MHKIICSEPSGLTGSVGSTTFVNGEGETEDEAMLAYFLEHPERFEVSDAEQVEETPEPKDEDPTPAPQADSYDELTDEQVAEAYATNVAGNATSRKGQLKALRALDNEE